MEKSNQEQVMAARAQLESELASICREICTDEVPENAHVYGRHHVVSFPQIISLEQLVGTHLNKAKELSAPIFAADPQPLIAEIRTSYPAYEAGGVHIGYLIRHALFKSIKGLALKDAAKREIESSLHAAADPAVKAEFEQWYREEVSTEPADLEKWNNSLYIHESTHQYFAGFIGGLGRRNAAVEAALAERAQNVQPRLDALINQVSAQLERSRQALGSTNSGKQG
jgi:hypothetical protein